MRLDAKLHAIITCKVEDCCSGLTYCYNKEFIFFHCLIVLYYRTVNHSSLYNNSAHPPICVQYFLTFNDLILYGTSSSARNFFFSVSLERLFSWGHYSTHTPGPLSLYRVIFHAVYFHMPLLKPKFFILIIVEWLQCSLCQMMCNIYDAALSPRSSALLFPDCILTRLLKYRLLFKRLLLSLSLSLLGLWEDLLKEKDI